MAFMDKNVNFILVLVIVIILIAMVGLVMYFQISYNEVVEKSRSKDNELNELQSVISELQNMSQELNVTLSTKTGDIQNLSTQYVTEVQAKESLNQSLQSTRQELENTNLLLANTKNELASTRKTLSTANAELANATLEIKSLNDSVEAYIEYTPDVRNYLDDLVNYVTEIKGDVNNTPSECIVYLEEVDEIAVDIDKYLEKIEEANE